MSEINLSDIFQTIDGEIETELVLEAGCFGKTDGEYEVVGMEPLALTIRNKEKGKAVIRGKTTVFAEMFCDRCLKPVRKELAIDFEREAVAPDLLEHDPDQAEDQMFVEGYNLIPKKLLQEEIIMSIPAKVLCREDCRGICPVCGKDLNQGDCGCDTFVPDPRMAVIADLFKG